MMDGFKSISRERVSEMALDQLKRYIIGNKMKDGDKLPSEPQLSASLDISRPSVREALKTLEGIGVIKSVQGKGRFISDFDYKRMIDTLSYNIQVHFQDFKEIVEMRQALEEHFLPKASVLLSTEDFRELDDLLLALREAVMKKRPEPELMELHARFHRRLYEPVGNKLLDSLIAVFAMYQKHLFDINQKPVSGMEFYEKHRLLLQSVRSKDKAGIQACLSDHFSDFEQ